MKSRVFAHRRGKHQPGSHTPLSESLVDSPIDYSFEAIVTVDSKSWGHFDQVNENAGGQLLVKLFNNSGLNLLHSSWRVLDADSIQFTNYWHLGHSANALVNAEIMLSDFVAWAEFDRSVQRNEDKNIISPLVSVDSKNIAKGLIDANAQYLRIVYDVRPADLEEFQARMEAYVETYGSQRGWLLGTTFLYITGREGRVVQLWLLPAGLVPNARDEAYMWQELAKMPWLSSSKGAGILEPRSVEDRSQARLNPQWSFNSITPLDPLLSNSQG